MCERDGVQQVRGYHLLAWSGARICVALPGPTPTFPMLLVVLLPPLGSDSGSSLSARTRPECAVCYPVEVYNRHVLAWGAHARM